MVANKFTIYSDPILGNEIVIVSGSGRNFGAIYHPQKNDPVLPWHQDCQHCLRGKQENLSIQLKRMIQLFCSESPLGENSLSFIVPSNSDPYLVELQLKENGSINIIAEKHDRSSNPYIVSIVGKKITNSKNKRDYQSPILSRAIKTLSSVRRVDSQYVLNVLRELILNQKSHGLPIGNYSPCKKINWFSVLGE